VPAAEGPAVVLVGGKGGVGKTTVACALALASARAGRRTLLVSTDPAHSTADLLRVGPAASPVPVAEGWSLLEVDGDQAAREHVERIAEEARGAVPDAVLPAVRRHLAAALASPGTHESAVLDRLGDVLVDAAGQGWERVVVDTAPTGHTLRLLALPDLLGAWVDGLVRSRQRFLHTESLVAGLAREAPRGDDPVAARLRERRDRLLAMRDLLRARAVVHLVTVPERLAVLETVRAAGALRETGLRLGSVVVNRVFPAGDHPFLAARARRQQQELDEVARQLPDLPRVVLEHRAEDVAREDLDALADTLTDAGL
jgi:arsenite/tail-anchored protein-transporting ATPase